MTTAHLTSVLDERYFELERMHGEEGSRLAAESHLTAINRIETIVASERIECDFERLNGYLFLAPDDDEETLARELEAVQRAGMDAALVELAPKPAIERGRCLLFPNQAQFHPLNYVAGLARAIQRIEGSPLPLSLGGRRAIRLYRWFQIVSTTPFSAAALP